MQVDNSTTVVGASFVLHNICELIGDYCIAQIFRGLKFSWIHGFEHFWDKYFAEL